jgi:glycosyltransferase involved in cell wall biosynthesis
MVMKVLVVIPVYNRPNMVIEALDAAARQTYPPHSILVVDDGSTDETNTAVTRWIASKEHDRAQIVSIANGGAAAARNHGLRLLGKDHDAIAFLDSDDLWPVDFIERTTSLLDRHANTVAASTDRIEWNVQRDSRRKIDSADLVQSPWLHMLAHGAGIASCTLIRAKAIFSAGGFPENVPTGHDAVLFSRVARLGEWMHAAGEPVTFRRNFCQSYKNDSDHLHKTYTDHEARWASVSRSIVREAPLRIRINPRIWRLMSKKWHAAAVQAIGHERMTDARKYSLNALICNPFSIRYWRLYFNLRSPER